MTKLRILISLLISVAVLSVCFTASSAVYKEAEAYLSEEETEDISASYPDMLAIDFASYHDNIVNNRDTGWVSVVEKDGRRTVKTVPNKNAEDSTATVVDGYHYTSAKIHVGVYKYAAVEYFYESDDPLTNIKMRLNPLINGGSLLKSVSADSQSSLKANVWDIAVFNLSAMGTNANPNADNPHLMQMHTYPFGTNNIKKHKGNDAMYISKIMFFKEKPTLKSCRAYMNGYDDGTFRPSNLLSRAEACAVAARVLEDDPAISGSCSFKDVDASAWYARYIGFCEENGLLDWISSNSFEPTNAITKKEFATMMVSAYSLYGTGSSTISSSDRIFESAESITSATGNDDAPISRAEATMFINGMMGRSVDRDTFSKNCHTLYLDVKEDHYAYSDIAEATVAHVESNGEWVYTLSDHEIEIEQIVGIDYFYKTSDGYAKIAELDELEAERISQIQSTFGIDPSEVSGKAIYVSHYGDDSNNGMSEYYPVRTLTRANSLASSGDIVLLERGGMWREKIVGKKGVTYSAYGYGDKPILNGSPENGADQHKWTLVYENAETGALIWRYDREDWLDVGGIVFNGGEGYAYKDLPDCIAADDNDDGRMEGKYVVYGNRSKAYDYTVELDRNFEFVHLADSSFDGTYFDCNHSVGELYLRCDNGNPGKVFDSIEFITRGANIACSSNTNVTIDNLCFKYSNFGVSSSTTKNLTVTNCEFYWIGGSVQTYSMRSGVATRYGNAIEIYGGVDGFLVDNCYFYEVYDAAMTHQVGNQDSVLHMDNIVYSNNVMDKCQYSIEYFFGGVSTDGADFERNGTNVLFTNNLCRRAGYGFGSTRRDLNSQRHIRSGGSRNEFYNFRIENNIFDRSVYELTQTTCAKDEFKPTFDGNVYIQGVRNRLFSHSIGDSAYMNLDARESIKKILGDTNAEVYYVDQIPPYEWSFKYDKKVNVTPSDRE